MSQFRTIYGKKDKVLTVCDDISLTKQCFKDECDINILLKRYQKTGQLPSLIKSDPKYGDFSNVADYQEALNIVITAHEQFNALPSAMRDKFANDPAKFLEFTSDEKNVPEMVKMGLAFERPTNASDDKAPVVKPPESGNTAS